jgi:hypothetical protein
VAYFLPDCGLPQKLELISLAAIILFRLLKREQEQRAVKRKEIDVPGNGRKIINLR